MKNNDVELIHRILDGDDSAFSTLVERYQKQVHALAWRKIGDFHIAEEITQDTFLKAYQKLAALKKPQRFSGWLYVIASHCCDDWLRKKQIQTESLDELENKEIDPEAYSRYVAEQETKVTVAAQRQVVKKLLALLPESERTVITLHYFGEMTCEKMSEFLGVSANTIKSRLRRARNRLKQEEPMIREAISNFQISPHLTDDIMREIGKLKPAAPTVSKPFVPWIIGASSAIIVVLMLGLGSQYLASFQKPYSLDAQAERTVDIVDAPIVQNVVSKPDVRNQPGLRSIIGGKGTGDGKESNQVLGNEGDYTQWDLPEGAKTRLGKGRIDGISFSPDGTQIAVGSATGVWIYDTQTGAKLSLLTDHTTHTGKVAYSPDGKTLASGLYGNISLWDTETGKLLKTSKNEMGLIKTLRMIDDGKTLRSDYNDGSVRLWDITTGVVKGFQPPPLQGTPALPNYILGHVVKAIDLYHNNVDNKGIFALGEVNGKIQLKDAMTGRHLKTLQDHKDPIIQLVFSPDGTLLVSYYPLCLWDVTTGKLLKTLTKTRQNTSYSLIDLTFSNDSKIFAYQMGRDIKLWDVATNTHRTTLSGKTDGAIQEFAFSADSNRVVGTYRNGKIRIWDVNTGDELFSYNKGHTSQLIKLLFSPNNTHLAAGYTRRSYAKTGYTITLWDTLNFTQLPNRIDTDGYSAFVFSPDGNTVTSTSSFMHEKHRRNEFVKESVLATLSFWDTHTGKNIFEYPVESHKGEIPEIIEEGNFSSGGHSTMGMYNPVIFSQDGYMLATFLNTKREPVFLHTEREQVTDDSRFTIFLWEVWEDPRRQKHLTLKGHTDKIRVLAFTPNGDILASGSDDGTIRLWDTSTGTQMLSRSAKNTNSLAFSMDGKILASASDSSQIQLWDISTGKQLASLNGQNEPVTDLEFSPDNKILASCNRDGTIRLWNFSAGTELTTFKGHVDQVNTLSFSSDGKTLASGSRNGAIFIWKVPYK